MRPMWGARTAALTATCLLACWPAACPARVGAGGSLALTSDDVYRGLSQTCGHPAAQAGLYVRDSGSTSRWAAFAGVWGSNGLGSTPCGAARELNAYAGYSVALGSDIDMTVTYTRYAFPGGNYSNPHLRGQRYDYDQLSATWGFAERLYLTLSWTPDALQYERYDGVLQTEQGRGAFSYGLEWQQPLVYRVSLTAAAGYDRMADPFGTGYGFFSAGLTHTAGPVELNVAYFHTATRAERLFGPEVAGGRVSATVRWRF